jgi:general secretion pathway protein A
MSSREDTATTIIHKTKFKTGLAMLKKVCDDFGVPRKKSMLDQEGALEGFLKEQFSNGKTVVLLIDEGQGINAECLEVIRSLLNYETNTHKLIQIVMAGQLDLAERLLQKKYKAIKSRIFAPCMVNPMTIEETRQLIQGRCEYWQIGNPFDSQAMERIYQRTDGVPRHVLNLAAMAAELGRVTGAYITPEMIDQVAEDMTIRLQQEESSDEHEAVAVA